MQRMALRLFLAVCLFFPLANVGLADGPEPVNINTADAETLAQMLSGVGVARAEAIVEYRDANGDFATADDLTAVSGIGPATVDANRQLIIVE
ncbi:competence protein ComEA [Natronocella acetinitrilica]|uniref:Competence protein ComEA n=1 Tax=Natronocella acetinitrilica TaxID=414046 RepID=A0AAE3G2W7_9GAMM|nr:competence protein ComEA [Natronocella acetinitrilica]